MNSNLFNSECNKCGNYGQRASDCWGNKNENRNYNKTEINPHFNGECNNCGKGVHRADGFGSNKGKQKDNDVDKLFVREILCVEVQEEKDKEYPEEWLGDSGASLHIIHKKKDITEVEKCDFNITVGNGHKMKCKLKRYINMKLKYGKTVKLTEVLYMPQDVKNILSVSKLVSKGVTMGPLRTKLSSRRTE